MFRSSGVAQAIAFLTRKSIFEITSFTLGQVTVYPARYFLVFFQYLQDSVGLLPQAGNTHCQIRCLSLFTII